MKPQARSTSADRTSETPARKPYSKPKVQVYGDLATITKTLAGTKTNDGAAHPNKHFTS
jgi:hypothetical protein